MTKKNRQTKQSRRAPRKPATEEQEARPSPPELALPPAPEGEHAGKVEIAAEESPIAVATEPAASDSPPGMPATSSDPKPDDPDPALSEEKSEPSVPEELELLTFNLAQEEYAVDIMVIQEITKLTEITRIPRIPAYVRGIITLRGTVIPVFDMHARLGLASFVKGPRSRFIICTTENGMVAMVVDQVNDVVRLTRRDLEATPPGVAAIDAGFIKNIAKYKDRLLILLDVNKTLQIDQK